MTWLFYVWLGGAIGHTIAVTTSPVVLDAFARINHSRKLKKPFRRAAFATFAITLVCSVFWPVGVIAYFLPAEMRANMLSGGQQGGPVRCPECGYESRIELWNDWVRLPEGWWLNKDHEICCSRNCADRSTHSENQFDHHVH